MKRAGIYLSVLIITVIIALAWPELIVPASENKKKVELFDNHSTSYLMWMRENVRQRTVIHFDGHPDIDLVDSEGIRKVINANNPMELRKLEYVPYGLDMQRIQPLSLTNYIFLAWKKGMIKRYIWVVPDKDPVSQKREAYKNLLARKLKPGYESALILHKEGSTITGSFGDLAITICRFCDLPPMKEIVLLDVDADYFTTRNGLNQDLVDYPVYNPEIVFKPFLENKITFDIVTISRSVEGGYTPLQYMFLGDMIGKFLLAKNRRIRTSSPGAPFMTALHIDRGESEKSRDFLKHLVPGTGETLFLQGLFEEKFGSPQAAGKLYAHAGARGQHYKEYMLYRGDEYRKRSRGGDALSCYLKYLEIYQGDKKAAALYKVANCYESTGKLLKAVDYYKKLLFLKPDSVSALNGIGVCYARIGQEEEALACFKKALVTDPANSGVMRNLLKVTEELKNKELRR